MKVRNILLMGISHIGMALLGFAAGIYTLPILIAPDAPASAAVAAAAAQSTYIGEFSRERADSDALHWGEGQIAISTETVSFAGKLAPGPDYKLYFSPKFVETEAQFNALKASMALVGDVKTFDNFVVAIPPSIDPANYEAVIVWCESFGQFITSARYQRK